MIRVARIVITLVLAATIVRAQAPVQKPPAFEVASIKPASDDDVRFAFRIEPDGTTAASGITLQRLMMTAYGVPGFRLVGGPDWVTSKRWDLQAKHDGLTSPVQIRQMLRALLEDRFHLHTHSDSRNLPVYELVVDRNGLKVSSTKDASGKPLVRVAAGSLQLTNATTATFASQLSYSLARPVIDKTNLSGTFDFALEWTPLPNEDGGPATAGVPPGVGEPAPATSEGVSIFTAIREQLGLRLNSARGPVDVLVIDHVEKPTPD